MKTEEFIAELAKRLAVLTEEERRDILEEYEQHIDMKSYKGISGLSMTLRRTFWRPIM